MGVKGTKDGTEERCQVGRSEMSLNRCRSGYPVVLFLLFQRSYVSILQPLDHASPVSTVISIVAIPVIRYPFPFPFLILFLSPSVARAGVDYPRLYWGKLGQLGHNGEVFLSRRRQSYDGISQAGKAGNLVIPMLLHVGN